MQKLAAAGLAVAIGVGVGYVTATTYLNDAAVRAVTGNPDWKELDATEELGLLPYALGRFLAAGQLPPSTSVRQFFRNTDDKGNVLRGDCAYVLEGIIPPARRWSIAATDNTWHALGPRAVAVSGQTLRSAESVTRITLSQSPTPGNWIEVSNATYQLVITLHDMVDEQDEVPKLPSVLKGRC